MALHGANQFETAEPLEAAGFFLDHSLQAPPKDRFTAHVFECLLTIARNEARETDAPLELALGLSAKDLDNLLAAWTPQLMEQLAKRPRAENVELDEEEMQLLDLFQRHRVDDSAETRWIATIMARRCMSPNHLWQDLGLDSRQELGRLMRERFPDLAARNKQNMKWKKFFYRCLCELEGFTLCAAPTCQECNDYSDCFGEETGDARPTPRSLNRGPV
jgi:nitrogen fixation protein NifQ